MSLIRTAALAAGALLSFAALPAQARWVASWAAAPQAPTATGPRASASYDNVTLSQFIRLSEGGRTVRVVLTNRYGTGPLEIGAARIVRIDDTGAEVPGTGRMLSFSGQTGAIIPAGAPFVSDDVALTVPDLARVKVELYLPKPTGPCTCHMIGLDDLFVSPPGNFVGRAFEPADKKTFRAFLAAVEVDSPSALGTIVTFGDSITDGVGASVRTNTRWPDILANRLQAAGRNWGVANVAISGNRVLNSGAGESALSRFDEDVLSLPNVKYVILFEGVNDIGNRFGPPRPVPAGAAPPPPQPQITVEQMIAGYKQFVARAHKHGIKVIGSPIGPYKGAGYWSEAGEAARTAINDWMLNSDTFDGVVRIDSAYADPADPQKMRDDYHVGDRLHGNDAAYRAVGAAIDLRLFKP